ncbi:venom allergen 5-like [Diabrotica virgifera virgifera]|uniref:SCP domain-containing protein n=2 Tax=Diabrotica virgifera virgifera TaxID=50390 RepID=A0ABM5IE63_DIAVI|nr:venom allergen 5-like [Diabrotica virgifera virgifera]
MRYIKTTNDEYYTTETFEGLGTATMNRSVAFLLLFFVLHTAKTDYDWCQYKCKKGIHTLCERQKYDCGAGPACKNFQAMYMTNEDRQFIIDLHNQLRNRVALGHETIGPQPSATNMQAMSYNTDLEYIAQCHTNECVYHHDTCRSTSQWDWVGQSIMQEQFIGQTITIREMINSTIHGWYDEVKIYPPEWAKSFDTHGKKVGHYTQIVWADTNHVGCGITKYLEDGWETWYMACNYGPGGNAGAKPLYEQGPPASNCGGLPRNPKYPGLCGTDTLQKV